MSVRSATVWVIACDHPTCLKLAVPAQLRPEQREKDRRALHLSHAVDAFTTASEAGWVTEPAGGNRWKHYCPAHTDVPGWSRPIRHGSTPASGPQAPLTTAPAPHIHQVEDVPLPDMPA